MFTPHFCSYHTCTFIKWRSYPDLTTVNYSIQKHGPPCRNCQYIHSYIQVQDVESATLRKSDTWATLGCLKALVLLWNSFSVLCLSHIHYDTICVAIFKPPPWSQSINSSPGFLFRPHIRLHSSLPLFSALILARQWHPQAHLTRQLSGPGFITGRSAGKVRYLAVLTSWRRIYADDDSHCPLAILLLPLCRSVQSPDIDSIRIVLHLSLFSCSITLPVFKRLLGHIYLLGGFCREIVSPFVRQSF